MQRMIPLSKHQSIAPLLAILQDADVDQSLDLPMHDRWADPGASTELGQGDFSLGVAQRLGEDRAHGVRSHERRPIARTA